MVPNLECHIYNKTLLYSGYLLYLYILKGKYWCKLKKCTKPNDNRENISQNVVNMSAQRNNMHNPMQRNKCKNISIKMLKDVGMTVPKSRETRAVYMQQHMGYA